ncbi:MAG TPA: sulfotransferase domain-containing protein [Terriglobia bacterium]|nr:sulfotransferase domain-containing protein [Terriglobia bacterium]
MLNRPAGRAVTVYPDDVFLVSYPRVGSNWTRFLICNLLQPEEGLSLPAAEARIPGIYINSDRALRRLPRPRILKSHEPYDARYPRVIYIVRDPRDVAVSRYYFTLKWRGIPDGFPFEDFVKQRFLVAGNAVLNTGPWGDHVIGWLTARAEREEFLLVKYEDLKKDTAQELRRIATLLRVDPDSQRIARAIELSSFDRMRSLDQTEPLKWLKRGRSDVPFIREGRMGGWRTVLPEEAVAAIEAAWWPAMQLLGYELATHFSNGLPEPQVNAQVCEALAKSLKRGHGYAPYRAAALADQFPGAY